MWVSYSYADDPTGVWCLQQAQISPLMFSPPVTARVPSADVCVSPQKIQAVPGLLILYPGVDSNFWLSRSSFSPSQARNWKTWCVFSMSYVLKRCFLLPLGEGFKVAGRLSCPLPAAGRSPEVRPSRSRSAVPGLAPVGPVSSQSFPSYCFPGSLGLQQLFTSLGLPFFGRGLPFSPAALPHSSAPATRVPALLLSLFPIPPATTYQPCCLSSPAS